MLCIDTCKAVRRNVAPSLTLSLEVYSDVLVNAGIGTVGGASQLRILVEVVFTDGVIGGACRKTYCFDDFLNVSSGGYISQVLLQRSETWGWRVGDGW